MERFVFTPLAVLLAGVILQLVLGKVLSTKAKGWLAFLAGLVSLVMVVSFIPTILQGKALDASLFTWDEGISFAYHVDGLSLVFCLMAAGIGTAILLYCINYMEHEESGVTRFYALMLTFIAGLINLVCSANLLVSYLSWEVIGLCSYFLVGFWYKQSAAAEGAKKVLVITHLAGYGFLAGILLLFTKSGSFLWTDPALQAAFTSTIFVLILVAAMAKSVMFPLHTWIPEAMNAPTPVSALLHSACYVKAGVYLVARLYSIADFHPAWNTIILVIGCVTMLVGAIFALAQTDLKRLLAFSTISQLGHIITALGLGTAWGAAAGIFYCLSHGLFKGTLFLCAGAVQHATGTRDMRRMGGLASRMPHTMRIWLVAAAAIVGVPLGNGFVAKWLLYDAALSSGAMVVVLVAFLASILTAFYMLKATVSVFFGEMPAELAKNGVHEVAPKMLVGMGTLAALCVVFGVAPQLLMRYVVAPAVTAMNFDWAGQLSWLGIRTSTSGVQVTAGALIVVIALGLGALVFAATRPTRKPVVVNTFTGGDPLPEGDMVTAVDFADMAETAFQPVYRLTDPDPVYLGIWHGVTRLSAGLGRLLAGLEQKPLISAFGLAVLTAVVVWLW